MIDRERPVLVSKYLFLWLFLAVLVLQLSALSRPLLGYFASYQLSSAMVAKSFLREGFAHPLLARTFYLMKGEPAVILLFPPLSMLLAAWGTRFSGLDPGISGKIVSLLFGGASFALFYGIVKKLTQDAELAFFSLIAFLLFPVNIVVAQCLFNESLALFFFLLGLRLVLDASENALAPLLAGTLLCSLAFTLRIHFVFLTPVVLYRVWECSSNRGRNLLLSLVGLGSLLSFWLAYVYFEAPQHPGLHSSLFMQAAEKKRFLLTPAILKGLPSLFWGYLMNPLGFACFVLGAFRALGSSGARIFLLWCGCGILLLGILPQKVYDHPFYFVPFLPGAAVLAGIFYQFLARQWGSSKRLICFLILNFLIALRFVVGPLYVQSPAAEKLLRASREIAALSAPEDILIVSDDLPTAILYYSNRLGWAFPMKGEDEELAERFKEMMQLRKAQFYVVTDKAGFERKGRFSRQIRNAYRPVKEADDYVIFELRGGDVPGRVSL